MEKNWKKNQGKENIHRSNPNKQKSTDKEEERNSPFQKLIIIDAEAETDHQHPK